MSSPAAESGSSPWSPADGVVFISGVARGQGRAHALRFAELGASVAGCDLCGDLATVPYRLATEADLESTRRALAAYGDRFLVEKADVRDAPGLARLVARVEVELGPIGTVVANAGIFSVGEAASLSPASWQDVIDVNLTGAWNTVQACLPSMIARGRGGSIVFTSSIGGMQGLLQCPHYVASKHGVIGLMRALANELGERGIRVNAVCPTNVDTMMIQNDANYRTFRPDLESPMREDVIAPATAMHILPTPWVQPEDVSDAVVWLASRAARFVTAAVLPVDAGATAKVSN